MAQAVSDVQGELTSRHRTAAAIVTAMLVLAVLLIVGAPVVAESFSTSKLVDPTLGFALRIGILIAGLGAIAYRRTKFSAARLQAVAAVRGETGLLASLEKTTVVLGLLGGAIAVMGFTSTIVTHNRTNKSFDLIGFVAIAVLLYCYPRRAAWQRVVQGIEEKKGAPSSSSESGSSATPAKGSIT